MATLADDFIRFEDQHGTTLGHATVVACGLEWPPPKVIATPDGLFTQVSCSQLSDEVANHPNLARGALYRLQVEEPV